MTVRRRIVVSSAAAVAVVAVASGVAWAGLPSTRPPIDTAVTPSAGPPADPTPSPMPSVVQDAPPAPKIPERLYYVGKDSGVRVLDGTKARTLFTPPAPACGLVLSPDRTRIAWVATDGGGATGDLIVAKPDGTDRRTVKARVSCVGGNSPVWQPDSRELLLTRGNNNPRVLLDASDGHVRPTPLQDVRGYVALSPDGSHVAYGEDGEVVVARYEGPVVHRFAHGDVTPTGGFSVHGVSDDGRRVVLGALNTDPDLIRTGFRLVDATTGDLLRGEPGTELHLGGTTVLARTNGTLTLRSVDGRVLDTRAEPAALRTATLLGGW